MGFRLRPVFQALSDAADETPSSRTRTCRRGARDEIDVLRGARLEWSEEGTGGLVLVNPTRRPACAERRTDEVLAAGITGRSPCGPRRCSSRL